MISDDTIFAPATADGPAARGIVRVAGPRAAAVARGIAGGWWAAPGSAVAADLAFARLVVSGWIYYFRSPHSYTGDDTIEFHLPGNPILIGLLCDELIRSGCRPATAGEFTARAYFAGKMDLTEAEGVAATIAAAGAAELSAARRLMSGELARRLRPVTEGLADMLALVEAEIDFSDQDVTFLAAGEVARRAAAADGALATLLSDAGRLEPAGYPPTVVLVGRPNAGKSSLVNALTGRARSVVSDSAGTTRDVLSAEMSTARGAVTLLDVAGLDDGAGDELDRQMRAHAARAIESADRVLRVTEAGDDRGPVKIDRPVDVDVVTKIDLPRRAGGRADGLGAVVSAVSGEGLADLRGAIDRACFDAVAAPTVVLNGRHRAAIADARAALSRVDAASAELAAADLREALDAVGAVTGVVTPDDVLGRVFSTFCIGK